MDDRTRRLYDARRAGLVARIASEGVGTERVERAFDAWEEEAYSRGLSRLESRFWTDAPAWIREEAENRRH